MENFNQLEKLLGYVLKVLVVDGRQDLVSPSALAIQLENLANKLEENAHYLQETSITPGAITTAVSPIWESLETGSPLREQIREAVKRINAIEV